MGLNHLSFFTQLMKICFHGPTLKPLGFLIRYWSRCSWSVVIRFIQCISSRNSMKNCQFWPLEANKSRNVYWTHETESAISNCFKCSIMDMCQKWEITRFLCFEIGNYVYQPYINWSPCLGFLPPAQFLTYNNPMGPDFWFLSALDGY